jgi:hypothetical protein
LFVAFCFFSITAGPLEQIILRFVCKVRNHKRKARILITLDFPKNISFTLLEEGVGIAGTHRGRVVMVVVFNATLNNISNEIFFGKSSVIKILAFLLWFLTLHKNLKMICSSGPAVIEKKQHAWTDGRTWYNLMPCTPSSGAIKIQQRHCWNA